MDFDKYIASQVKDYEKKPPRKVWFNVFLFLHYSAIANIWFTVKPILLSKWVYIPAAGIIAGTGIYYGTSVTNQNNENEAKQLTEYIALTDKPLIVAQSINTKDIIDNSLAPINAKAEQKEYPHFDANKTHTENVSNPQKEEQDAATADNTEIEAINTTENVNTATVANKHIERAFLLKTDDYSDIKNVIFKNSHGKVVLKVAYQKTQEAYFSIDIAKLPKGRYTIYLETPQGEVKHKTIQIK